MSAYAKAINAETAEIRLLRVNKAVTAILMNGGARWDKRTNARGKPAVVDVLIVRDMRTWEKLLPHFVYGVDK